MGRTLLEGKIVHIENIHDNPEYALEASKLEGWRTMLGVPLLREGTPVGVIAQLFGHGFEVPIWLSNSGHSLARLDVRFGPEADNQRRISLKNQDDHHHLIMHERRI